MTILGTPKSILNKKVHIKFEKTLQDRQFSYKIFLPNQTYLLPFAPWLVSQNWQITVFRKIPENDEEVLCNIWDILKVIEKTRKMVLDNCLVDKIPVEEYFYLPLVALESLPKIVQFWHVFVPFWHLFSAARILKIISSSSSWSITPGTEKKV